MTYLELIESANRQLERGYITLGEYDQMVEPLRHEIKSTIYGYDVKHLMLIADVLRKENLSPRLVADALTDMGRFASIVRSEFEENLRKTIEQSLQAIQ